MRTALLLLAFGIFSIVAPAAIAQEKQPPEIIGTDSKVVKLLIERREVLSQVAKIAHIGFNSGTTSFDAVCEAEGNLANANLALAGTAEARSAIHKTRIQWLQKLEDYRERQFENATGGRVDYLNAKADRLQAEIDMLQDRSAVLEK